MFRKMSNGFRMPSGEVKVTPKIVTARASLSVESTIKDILELYVSRKNMSAIMESNPIVASSSYYLFKEYFHKPISQMTKAVLDQVIRDINADRIPLLKDESTELKEKLVGVMDAHLSAIPVVSLGASR